VLGVFAVYLALTTALAHLGALDVLSAVLESAGAFLFLSALGNYISIIAPYRVPSGSLKPAKAKGAAQLLLIATHMFLPLALLPVFIPVLIGLLSSRLGLASGGGVILACAFLMAAGCGVLYWRTLGPLEDCCSGANSGYWRSSRRRWSSRSIASAEYGEEAPFTKAPAHSSTLRSSGA